VAWSNFSGMFVPSFFTGWLIDKLKPFSVIMIGMVLFGLGLGLYFMGNALPRKKLKSQAMYWIITC
jgi:MFS family permease